MSAPVRQPDDDGSIEGTPSKGDLSKSAPSSGGPLEYAPKKARQAQRDRNPNGGSKQVLAAPPRRMPEPPEPPRQRRTQRGAFAGDVAVVEMRTQLALTPNWIPEPPLPAPKSRVFAWAGRILGVIAVATAAVGGYRWGSRPATPPASPLAYASHQADLVPREPAANLSTPIRDSKPPATRSVANVLAPETAAGQTRGATNGAAPADAAQGLAPATQARAVAAPVAAAPGAVSAPAPASTSQPERSAPDILAPAKPPPRRLEADEIALMMKNGAAFLANGNIGAARMMFQPAAEAGDPVAAFALAETYDPSVLRKLGAKGGIASDIALAHSWYEKARNLGSTLAAERLERLARIPE